CEPLEQERAADIDDRLARPNVRRLESDADLIVVLRVRVDDAHAVRGREARIEKHRFIRREIIAVAAEVLAHVPLGLEGPRRTGGHVRPVGDDVLRAAAVALDLFSNGIAPAPGLYG